MRRISLATLVAMFMLAAGLFASGAQADRPFAAAPDRPEAGAGTPRKGSLDAGFARWVDGEVLVTFKKGVGRAEARSLHQARDARVLDRIGAGTATDLVRLPGDVSVEEAIGSYAADPAVAVVEPNLIRSYTNHVAWPPNDLFVPEYWGLNNTGQSHSIADASPGGVTTAAGTPNADINLPEAWTIPHGFTPVIAVMDSGVDVAHPDLAGQLWVNPGEVPADGVDNDANGKVDDVNGWNFAANNADLSDGVAHGTHVAGTIAAATNNGALPVNGGVGVCPQCRIMVLKLGSTPTLAGELQAAAYAIEKGAHVVNMSFGGPVWSQLERNAMISLQNAGILSAVAAGNAGLDNDMFLQTQFDSSPSFPASYNLDGIISVAASNHHDEYGYGTGCVLDGFRKSDCAFSSFGHDSVDIAAPGVDILSTVPAFSSPSQYAVYNGTSMATPHTAGVAGLLKAVNPALSGVQLKNAMMNSSARVGTLRTMYSPVFKRGSAGGQFTRTSGRLDAFGALTTTDFTAYGRSYRVATPKTDGNIDGAKKINRRKKGRVAYPHDVNDVFWKRLRKGKRYEVTLDVPRRKDYDLWVWKPKTKEIWQLEAKCLGAGPGRCLIQGFGVNGKGQDEVVTFKARKPGRYYFQVSTWLQSKGRYALTVKKI